MAFHLFFLLCILVSSYAYRLNPFLSKCEHNYTSHTSVPYVMDSCDTLEDCQDQLCPGSGKKFSIKIANTAPKLLYQHCFVPLNITWTLPENREYAKGFSLTLLATGDFLGYQTCLEINFIDSDSSHLGKTEYSGTYNEMTQEHHYVVTKDSGISEAGEENRTGGNIPRSFTSTASLETEQDTGESANDKVVFTLDCIFVQSDQQIFFMLRTVPRSDQNMVSKSFDVPKYYLHNNTCLPPTRPKPPPKATVTLHSTLPAERRTTRSRKVVSVSSTHSPEGSTRHAQTSFSTQYTGSQKDKIWLSFGVLISSALIVILGLLAWKMKKRFRLAKQQTVTTTEPLLPTVMPSSREDEEVGPDDSISQVHAQRAHTFRVTPLRKGEEEGSLCPDDSCSQTHQAASCDISDTECDNRHHHNGVFPSPFGATGHTVSAEQLPVHMKDIHAQRYPIALPYSYRQYPYTGGTDGPELPAADSSSSYVQDNLSLIIKRINQR